MSWGVNVKADHRSWETQRFDLNVKTGAKTLAALSVYTILARVCYYAAYITDYFRFDKEIKELAGKGGNTTCTVEEWKLHRVPVWIVGLSGVVELLVLGYVLKLLLSMFKEARRKLYFIVLGFWYLYVLIVCLPPFRPTCLEMVFKGACEDDFKRAKSHDLLATLRTPFWQHADRDLRNLNTNAMVNCLPQGHTSTHTLLAWIVLTPRVVPMASAMWITHVVVWVGYFGITVGANAYTVLKDDLKLIAFSQNQIIFDGLVAMLIMTIASQVASSTKTVIEKGQKLKFLWEENKTEVLDDMHGAIETIIPDHCLDSVIHMEPYHEHFELASVLIIKIVDFEATLDKLKDDPVQVHAYVNRHFNAFHSICSDCSVTKVETTGDEYICAVGVSGKEHENGVAHPMLLARLIEVANQMFDEADCIDEDFPDHRTVLQMGIHTGPVVTGIAGKMLPRFLVLGDTMPWACRIMQQGLGGEPGRVLLSSYTHRYLPSTAFSKKCEEKIVVGRKSFSVYRLLLDSESVAAAENFYAKSVDRMSQGARVTKTSGHNRSTMSSRGSRATTSSVAFKATTTSTKSGRLATSSNNRLTTSIGNKASKQVQFISPPKKDRKLTDDEEGVAVAMTTADSGGSAVERGLPSVSERATSECAEILDSTVSEITTPSECAQILDKSGSEEDEESPRVQHKDVAVSKTVSFKDVAVAESLSYKVPSEDEDTTLPRSITRIVSYKEPLEEVEEEEDPGAQGLASGDTMMTSTEGGIEMSSNITSALSERPRQRALRTTQASHASRRMFSTAYSSKSVRHLFTEQLEESYVRWNRASTRYKRNRHTRTGWKGTLMNLLDRSVVLILASAYYIRSAASKITWWCIHIFHKTFAPNFGWDADEEEDFISWFHDEIFLKKLRGRLTRHAAALSFGTLFEAVFTVFYSQAFRAKHLCWDYNRLTVFVLSRWLSFLIVMGWRSICFDNWIKKASADVQKRMLYSYCLIVVLIFLSYDAITVRRDVYFTYRDDGSPGEVDFKLDWDCCHTGQAVSSETIKLNQTNEITDMEKKTHALAVLFVFIYNVISTQIPFLFFHSCAFFVIGIGLIFVTTSVRHPDLRNMYFNSSSVVLFLVMCAFNAYLAHSNEKNLRHRYRVRRQISVLRERYRIMQASVLPAQVADLVKEYRMKPSSTGPSALAHHYTRATVCQINLMHFNHFVNKQKNNPEEVVSTIGSIMGMFEKLAADYRLYKLEIVGDAIIAAQAEPPLTEYNYPMSVVAFALAAVVRTHRWSHRQGKDISVRVGVHHGEVMGSSLGADIMSGTLRYHLFGNLIQQLNILQITASKGKVHCSESCKLAVEGQLKRNQWPPYRNSKVPEKVSFEGRHEDRLRTSKGDFHDYEEVGGRTHYALLSKRQ